MVFDGVLNAALSTAACVGGQVSPATGGMVLEQEGG